MPPPNACAQVLLDCGLVSALSDEDNVNFQDLFITIVEGDAERSAEMMIDRASLVDARHRLPDDLRGGRQSADAARATPRRASGGDASAAPSAPTPTTADAAPTTTNKRASSKNATSTLAGDDELSAEEIAANVAWRRAFVAEMSRAIDIRDRQLVELHVSDTMRAVLAACRLYGVQVQPRFATLVIATAVMEGIGRQLAPQVSLVDSTVPVLLRRHALLARERVSGWLADDDSLQHG